MSLPADALMEWALGTLPDAETRAVAAHIEGCRACRDEVAAIESDLSMLALALPPEDVSVGGIACLMGTVRYVHAPAVARHFDLPEPRVRALLDAAEDASAWVPGKHGMRLMHFPGGPALAAADCGFVRFPARGGLPTHRHPGDERVLVLQGRLRADGGGTWGPGESFVFPAGKPHAFSAEPGPELMLAVVKLPGAPT